MPKAPFFQRYKQVGYCDMHVAVDGTDLRKMAFLRISRLRDGADRGGMPCIAKRRCARRRNAASHDVRIAWCGAGHEKGVLG